MTRRIVNKGKVKVTLTREACWIVKVEVFNGPDLIQKQKWKDLYGFLKKNSIFYKIPIFNIISSFPLVQLHMRLISQMIHS